MKQKLIMILLAMGLAHSANASVWSCKAKDGAWATGSDNFNISLAYGLGDQTLDQSPAQKESTTVDPKELGYDYGRIVHWIFTSSKAKLDVTVNSRLPAGHQYFAKLIVGKKVVFSNIECQFKL